MDEILTLRVNHHKLSTCYIYVHWSRFTEMRDSNSSHFYPSIFLPHAVSVPTWQFLSSKVFSVKHWQPHRLLEPQLQVSLAVNRQWIKRVIYRPSNIRSSLPSRLRLLDKGHCSLPSIKFLLFSVVDWSIIQTLFHGQGGLSCQWVSNMKSRYPHLPALKQPMWEDASLIQSLLRSNV